MLDPMAISMAATTAWAADDRHWGWTPGLLADRLHKDLVARSFDQREGWSCRPSNLRRWARDHRMLTR